MASAAPDRPEPGPAGRPWRSGVATVVLGLVLALALAACTVPSLDEPEAVTSTTTTRPGGGAVPLPPPALAEPSPDVVAEVGLLPGRLAVGAGPRLALTAPDGSGEEVLEEATGSAAGYPTWSRDGSRLAWSRITPDGATVVIRDLATGAEVASDLADTPAFHLQWSPGDDAVAFLRNDPARTGVELGVVEPGAPPVRLGSASPLFFSWAPTSPTVAAHVASSQILVLPTPLTPRPAPEPTSALNPTGPFTTPAWLDDSTVLALSDQGLERIDVTTGARTLVAATGGGTVQFVVSPDRSRVAVFQTGGGSAVSPVVLPTTTVPTRPTTVPPTTRPATTGSTASGPSATGPSSTGPATTGGQPGSPGEPDGALLPPGLQVIDLDTGGVTPVTDTTLLAFEWSPDSTYLAWLESGVGDDPQRVRWNFWEGAASTPSATYQLSATMRDAYLPFFEQYAQAVTGWAPDSTAFAFAGRPDGSPEADGIWVQLVGVPGATPVRVADGDLVVWSPSS